MVHYLLCSKTVQIFTYSRDDINTVTIAQCTQFASKLNDRSIVETKYIKDLYADFYKDTCNPSLASWKRSGRLIDVRGGRLMVVTS